MIPRRSRFATLTLLGIILLGIGITPPSTEGRIRASDAARAQAPAVRTPWTALDKVAPEVWAQTADHGEASFLVIFQEQADLSGAAVLTGREDRSRYVYDALRSVAQRTQASTRAWLASRGIAYHSHYLVNMLAVTGDRSLLLDLAQRAEVQRISANPVVRGIDPLEVTPAPATTTPALEPDITEWGVRFVGAPSVWNRYDVRGQGIVIGGQDTGYEWDHPAIRDQYRGWSGETADHNYNWHDAIGGNGDCPNPGIPCDDQGHGTHTMGTALGDDGLANQIGVAPEAEWIGCRNMDEGNGTPSTYIECFEFLLAPYPLGGDPLLDGDPAQGAHVINNSWSCPPSEGCDLDSLRQAVENVRAAGILVVGAAGNQGFLCGSVLYPIAVYDAVFSVAAADQQGNLAPFSSRGPVTADGSNRMKPDITAPGVNVRSAYLGGTYGTLSGTSMAAPHVAGVVALLWSAEPTLVGEVDDTEFILAHTAEHVSSTACDSSGWPNNSYGWGHVDALTAVEYVLQPAEVQGHVLTNQLLCNSAETAPLPGAEVVFTNMDTGIETTAIAADGTFSTTVPPGPYEITLTHPDSAYVSTLLTRLVGYQVNAVTFPIKQCRFLPLLSHSGQNR